MTKATRALLAEAFGTFVLLFVGTGAIVVDGLGGGAITHVGIALTFGLTVLAMIQTIGDVSGCHLNPAVTLGFWAAGRFEGRSVAPFIASQCAGAILASLVLRLMFPSSETLGATLPSGTLLQAFVMEFLLTLILMVVILGVAAGGREKGLLAGVAVGATIALEALVGGPVSGASMNPARSLAPALVTRKTDVVWLYVAAPVAGALAGVATSRVLRGPAGTEHDDA